MTRAHRHRHRYLWLALAVLLPLVLIAGLLARRPVPVMRGDTGPLAPRASPFTPR